jgi:predicted PurR-regulated permease PerM
MSAESLLAMLLSYIPSTWNIVVSTIVFVLAFWYLQKWLNKSDKPKTAARGIGVIVLAFVLSTVSGVLVDLVREQMYGPEPMSQIEKEVRQQLEDSGITLPE